MGLRAPRHHNRDLYLLGYLLRTFWIQGARRTWRRCQSQQWYIGHVGGTLLHALVAHHIFALGFAGLVGVISQRTLGRPTASASLQRHNALHTMARMTQEVADHLGLAFSRLIVKGDARRRRTV